MRSVYGIRAILNIAMKESNMDGYIFEAAFWCGECTQEIKLDLQTPTFDGFDPDNELSYDSDEWPKGPFDMSLEESDTPEHCDRCGLFLENPLTSYGGDYVREAILMEEIPAWRTFYSYLWD